MVRRWGRSRGWLVLQAVVFVFSARAAWADDFDVICTGGSDPGHSTTNYPSIQAAVDAARSVSSIGPHTIWVSGDCAGRAVIRGMNSLTIQGTPATPGTPDDSLSAAGAPSCGSAVVDVSQTDGFQLNDLRVAAAGLCNTGIGLSSARGSVRRSLIEGAIQSGILVFDNSSLGLQDSRVVNNGGPGVNVGVLSAATLGGTIDITGNGGHGITVGGGSLLAGGGTGQIAGNQGRGIDVQNATIRLSGFSPTSPLSVFDNGRQGVFLFASRGNLGSLSINHNNLLGPQAPAEPSPLPGFFQCGLCLHGGTDVFVGTVQITESMFGAYGMVLRGKSGAHLRSVTITGNSADGIYLEAASGVLFLTSSNNVSGNGGSGANCIDPLSWVTGDLTGLVKLKCK